MQKYMAQATDPQKITCPICRKVTTLPDGDLTSLPSNFFMDNLKELITKETDGDDDEMKVMASADREMVICSLEDCQGEAVMYCTVDQEYLCQTCTAEHAAGRFTKKHQTMKSTETKGKVTSSLSSTESHHPCGRHPNQMLNMYCKTCEETMCSECCNMDHIDHHLTSLCSFVKPCEERLDTLLKRIDKLLKCVVLARQTSLQQIDKAQHHIANQKKQVTSTFTQIREQLAQQEEMLMSDLERIATRVDKVASSTQDEQQLAEVNLESLRFLGQSLLTGDVYDQMSNLPNLEEAMEKRWRTEIPGVVWKDQSDQDENKINMSDVEHLTLTETSYTTSVLPCLESDTGVDNVTGLNYGSDRALGLEGDTVSVTSAACKKPDQHPSESLEISRFSAGGNVVGMCLYSNTIFMVKRDTVLYMYSDIGVLIKKHVVGGMRGSDDVTVMTQDEDDKLVISSQATCCIYYIPVQSTGDTCTLGTTHTKKLNYKPYGLCVNDNNNLVVTDRSNESLHIYSISGDEINTIKLPAGVPPRFLASDLSGGYMCTSYPKQIIWIDRHGVIKSRYKDTACGVALSDVGNVVRDPESRYLVADCGNNQLLLFNKYGGKVRCLIKGKITRPFSLYLDQRHDKLYVGTFNGEVVVYDYYMLLGEEKPVKYKEKQREKDDIKYSLAILGIDCLINKI